MRLNTINLATGFIFLLLGLGILNMEVIQGPRFRELSNKNCIRLIPQKGSRGNILDRNGDVIVDNYLSYDAMVSVYSEGEVNKTLASVARILDKDFKELKDKFRRTYIAPFMPTTIANNIGIKKAIAMEELNHDLENIIIQPYPLRHYPYDRLACHVIGYLSEIDRWRLTRLADYGYKTKDIMGFGGIEQRYDYYLRQEEGGSSVEVDHRGRLVGVLGFRPPDNGKDIQLTLDLKVQKIAEEALEGRRGSIILMDPYSGEIMAMVSSPNYNPSAFVQRKGSDVARLMNNSQAPLLNRAISGVYPPASVFKLIVATAALEMGKINLSTTSYCQGSTRIGSRQFGCWDTHNQQNLIGAIVHSCDVFFYKAGIMVGAQNIYDYAVKFGFGHSTAVDLPYESNGFVPSPLWKKVSQFKNWFDGDTANFSIGQGELLVTPLQITRMMAVFANKGTLVTPYIVKTIAGKDITRLRKKTVTLSLKESTINYIRQGLKGVVSQDRGTASVLSSLPVSVAGKTGTAQVSRGQPHGWFTGFFPYNTPKFVICVLLENGGSGYAASVVAKQIIENMFKQGLT
ncbi:MAG: penicillin-binding protein 2 [Candidatus Omnitrophota bacterium]